MPRNLKDIDVEELSLVDAAANRKKFALKKRRESMDELVKMLKSVLGDADVTEDIKKQAGLIPEEPAKGFGLALKVLAKYKETFTEDLDAGVKALVKWALDMVPVAPAAEGDEFDVAKLGAKYSKATRDQLVKIKEAIEKLIGAQDDEEKKKSSKSSRELELETRVKQLEEEKTANLKKKADEDKAAKDKELADLKAENEALRKKTATRKSVTGQEEDGPAPVGTDHWPSMPIGQ